jgi:hypothetical protein
VAERRALRLAVLVRSMYPLHGLGGLERHTYDLVRHHLTQGLAVQLVTKPGTPSTARARDDWSALCATPGFSHAFVPYRTFPLAGRRGTTILDRSTAYPIFGARAGRVVAGQVASGAIDVVYAGARGVRRLRRHVRRPAAEADRLRSAPPRGLRDGGRG